MRISQINKNFQVCKEMKSISNEFAENFGIVYDRIVFYKTTIILLTLGKHGKAYIGVAAGLANTPISNFFFSRSHLFNLNLDIF